MVKEIPAVLVIVFLAWVAIAIGAYLALLAILGRSKGEAWSDLLRRHAPVLGVFYFALTIYMANCNRHLQVDTQPAVFGAMSLVRFGWFDLTPFDENVKPLRASVVLITGADGRTYSQYPPGSTIACVPFVLPFASSRRFTAVDLDLASKQMAAVCAALSVALLFAALRRLGYGAGAWISTIAYAFGTTLFSTGSQDSWQHAPAMLGLMLALYGIARTWPDQPPWAALIGAGLAWAFISRLTMIAPAVAVASYFLLRDRRRFAWLALGAAPFAVLWMYFASVAYGSPFRPGYWVTTGHTPDIHGTTSFLSDLYETFFNRDRGIFVYSPFLLAAMAGFWSLGRALVKREEPRASVAVFALSGFLVAALVAGFGQWPGGWSYGYRSASECAALFAPAFAVVGEFLWRRWVGRALVIVLVAASIWVHALEWAFPNDVWNARDEAKSRAQILIHWEYARWRMGR